MIVPQRPEDLTLTARNVRFDYVDAMKKSRYWHGNDPVITHFFNGLQAAFPAGEHFFIEAVRDTRDKMDRNKLPKRLKEDVRQFIRQEAFHGQEHEAWCKALDELGYFKIAEYDEEQRKLQSWAKKRISPLARLALVVAFEHFTTAIASAMLSQANLIENAKEPFRSALLYHILEEIEHKSVCFDLFRQAGGRYGLRMLGAFVSMILIIYQVRRRNVYLLKKDGFWNRNGRRKARKFIWGRKGLVVALLPRIFDFLKPSFQPWNIDERKDLISRFGHYLKKSGVPI